MCKTAAGESGLTLKTRKLHSFEELNAWLVGRALSRPVEQDSRGGNEQERGELILMPMPTAFDGYVERSAKV